MLLVDLYAGSIPKKSVYPLCSSSAFCGPDRCILFDHRTNLTFFSSLRSGETKQWTNGGKMMLYEENDETYRGCLGKCGFYQDKPTNLTCFFPLKPPNEPLKQHSTMGILGIFFLCKFQPAIETNNQDYRGFWRTSIQLVGFIWFYIPMPWFCIHMFHHVLHKSLIFRQFFIRLVYGKIYRKTPYLMVKTMVSG